MLAESAPQVLGSLKLQQACQGQVGPSVVGGLLTGTETTAWHDKGTDDWAWRGKL